jgi:chromosome segregation ATPase
MTDDTETNNGVESSAGRSVLGRVLGIIVRVLIAALVGLGLGIGAYLGVPALYRDFIAPVQQNTQQLNQARSELSDLQASQRAANATQLAQLADIQGQVASQGEALNALQADVGSLKAGQPTLVAGIRSLSQITSDLSDLQAAATQAAGEVQTLQAAAATPDATEAAILHRIDVLRLMQLVSQARISIAEGNLGQAGTDIESAQTALSNLRAGADESQLSALDDVGQRLTLAQQETKSNPSVAADDLDIAWQLLVELSRAP